MASDQSATDGNAGRSSFANDRPRISPFNPEEDVSFSDYLQRWDIYFLTRGIKDDSVKRNIFVDNQDNKTFRVILKMCAGNKIAEVSYKEITSRMAAYYQRAEPHQVVYIDKFFRRVQQENEPTAEFIADLLELNAKAGLDDLEDRVIVPKIISGLRNMEIRKKLLAKDSDTLTLKYVKSYIAAHDQADECSAALAKQEASDLNRVGRSKGRSFKRKDNVKQDKRDDGKTQKPIECFCCGKSGHARSQCSLLKTAQCKWCNRPGHVEAACFIKKKQKGKSQANYVNVEDVDEGDSGGEELAGAVVNHLLQIQHVLPDKTAEKKVLLSIRVNGRKLKLEVDSGATYSLIGWSTFKSFFPDESALRPTSIRMTAWGQKQEIAAAGKVSLHLEPKGLPAVDLDLLVMAKDGPSLLGRNWFKALGIKVLVPGLKEGEAVSKCSSRSEEMIGKVLKMTAIPEEYKDLAKVFTPELGTFKGAPVSIPLKKDAVPVHLPARTVPYGLRDTATEVLKALEKNRVIEKVLFSQWATPAVWVKKTDGSLRFCADYSATVNPACEMASTPIPSVDDLLAQVQPGYVYTKLDLLDAFLQLKVDEESSKVLTVNTHCGLYRFLRLPPELEYLGFKLTPKGVKPTEDKLKALREMPPVTSKEDLMALLGFINYYDRFIQNKAAILAPVYKLLRKDVPFEWTRECDDALEQKPLRISCDASRRGLGAVLSHVEDDKELPIMFASRTLQKAECNYSQIELEALAVVWSIKKFKKLPLPGEKVLEDDEEAAQVAFMNVASGAQIVDLERLQQMTALDPSLQQLKTYLLKGKSPESLPNDLLEYKKRWPSLKFCNGIVLFSDRAVVPAALRPEILALLHLNHFGQSKMKTLARQYFYWPHMDSAIEEVCQSCQPCSLFNKAPPKAQVIPWSVPCRPWGRVHLDFFEVRRGKTFIVAADGLSGWLDAEQTKNMEAETAIQFCRKLFRVQGLCDTLVADNGPGFRAEAFKQFCRRNSVNLIFAPPYSPQTNGVAERGVQTVKSFLKKIPESKWSACLDSFLLGHNSTPHSTTGVAPAEFNLGRRPVTVLTKTQHVQDLQRRGVEREKKMLQATTKLAYEPAEKQPITIRSYRDPKIKWEQAQFSKFLGPRRVLAETSEGQVQRHVDQVKLRAGASTVLEAPVEYDADVTSAPTDKSPDCTSPTKVPSPMRLRPRIQSRREERRENLAGEPQRLPPDLLPEQHEDKSSSAAVTSSPLTPTLRRSSRVTKVPKKLEDFVLK